MDGAVLAFEPLHLQPVHVLEGPSRVEGTRPTNPSFFFARHVCGGENEFLQAYNERFSYDERWPCIGLRMNRVFEGFWWGGRRD